MTRTTVADSVGPLGPRPASARLVGIGVAMPMGASVGAEPVEVEDGPGVDEPTPGGPVQASAMTTAMTTAMATARLTCGRVPIRPHLHACRSWSHLPGPDVQGTGYSWAGRDDDGGISAPLDAAMCISGAGALRRAAGTPGDRGAAARATALRQNGGRC